MTQFDPGTGHLLGLGCEAYLACEALPHALSSRVCLIALCVSSRSESVPPGNPKKGSEARGACVSSGWFVHMWQSGAHVAVPTGSVWYSACSMLCCRYG